MNRNMKSVASHLNNLSEVGLSKRPRIFSIQANVCTTLSVRGSRRNDVANSKPMHPTEKISTFVVHVIPVNKIVIVSCVSVATNIKPSHRYKLPVHGIHSNRSYVDEGLNTHNNRLDR